MWATCPLSASSGYHEFHEGYQKHTSPFNCSTVLVVQVFPATTRNFTKDTALSENGMGAAWHV
jgi:hypothetical protein